MSKRRQAKSKQAISSRVSIPVGENIPTKSEKRCQPLVFPLEKKTAVVYSHIRLVPLNKKSTFLFFFFFTENAF